MEWITALYARHFTKVPLVINYHRMLGDTYQEFLAGNSAA